MMLKEEVPGACFSLTILVTFKRKCNRSPKQTRKIMRKIRVSVGNSRNENWTIGRIKTGHLFYDFGLLSSSSHLALDGVFLPVCAYFWRLDFLIQNDGYINQEVRNRINVG